MFCTAGGNSVSVWRLGATEPFCLLETGNSQVITHLQAKTSSKGRFYVTATSSKTCHVFKLKTKDASKVCQTNCQLRLGPGID